jgi:orotate phosphoribosyltransferase
MQAESDFASNVTGKLYRNGTLTDTKTLTSNAAQRLTSARVKEHEIEVIAAVDVTAIIAAASAEDLKNV